MTVREIVHKLAAKYPPELALAWDNPGLQVGDTDRPVQKVYVALEATEAVIQECIAWGADLLVTHHPLLMSGIKQVNSEEFLGRKVLLLAENKIAHYAMHTNYDVTEMSALAIRALGLGETQVLEPTGALEDGAVYGIGFVGLLPEAMTAEVCCDYVKKAFELPAVRLFGDPEKTVRKIAVCPGSGKGMSAPALAAGADLLVTGDIGHHDGLDAVDQGLLMMDAGHYGIEHIFIGQMGDYLQGEFPELTVRKAEIVHPFAVL